MILRWILNKRKIFLLCSMLFLFFLLSACDDSENQTGTDEMESGTIQLQLSWKHNRPLYNGEPVDCEAVGVSTVMAEVYDENETFLKGGGPWDCEDHTGDISGIKKGRNRTVAIFGYDDLNQTVFRGEATDVTVGDTADVVQVDLTSFVPALSSPVAGQTVVNGACQFEWLTVEGATQYQIQVSADSGFSTTVIDGLVASTTYLSTGSLPVGTCYWRIKSTDRYDKESGWSPVESFNVTQGHTVTFSAAANGSLSGDASQLITYGGTTTAVEAVANLNYQFVNWTGDYSGTNNPLTITNVTSDMNVTANFEQITYFWITDTTPADSDSDVRIDSDIQVVFNQAIDPTTIGGTTISDGSTSFAYTSSWHTGMNTLTLDPDSELPAQSDITVTLPSTVTGYNNEVFTGDRNFSFRTGMLWHDGNTIFVSPAGETGNLGTKADPLRSIQEAVDTAYAQGYPRVYVQSGTYSYSDGGLEPSETACLHITESITIIGGWNPTFTAYSSVNSVLDGESSCDHVIFIQSSDVDLQYLEITGGYADAAVPPHNRGGGILIYNDAQQRTINIQDVDIDSNMSNDHGGGVYIHYNNRDITFSDCNISNNTSPSYNAAIRDAGSSNLTLYNVHVTDNSTQGIGTIYTTNLTIQNSYFRGNGTYAIYMWSGSNTSISNSYISSNDVGIYLNSNSNTADPFPNLSISNCRFSSSTYNSTTATAVFEGQSEVHGHAFTGNWFLPNYLAYLYEDWDGSTIPADAAGLAIINTSGHTSHDADPAQDNSLSY